jgi:hypothetical protein
MLSGRGFKAFAVSCYFDEKNTLSNNMEKRTNKYHLTLRLLQSSGGESDSLKQLELEFDNHDEIFEIVDRIKAKDLFVNKEQSAEFAIGLKMFSEVMIKNGKHPLFEELKPAFQMFMKRLKSM